MRGFMNYVLLAVGVIVILIVAVVAQQIVSASIGNFAGINNTIVSYLMTFLLVGVLVFIAIGGLKSAGIL